jgi:hypothetical protein
VIKRGIYQLLLRMHPRAFRERFTDEMLWLFDETLADAGLFKLYTDAAYSLVKQHAADGPVPASEPQPFQALHAGTLSATRIFQAGAIAALAMIVFVKMLEPPPPLPEPPRTHAIRRYVPDTCSETGFDSRSTRPHLIRRARIHR